MTSLLFDSVSQLCLNLIYLNLQMALGGNKATHIDGDVNTHGDKWNSSTVEGL